MVYAVLLSGIIVACYFFVCGLASKYSTLAVIGWDYVVQEKLIRLKTVSLRNHDVKWQKVINKLNSEIRVFNKLSVVMPAMRGVSVMYIQSLRNLYVNSRWICDCTNGYEKLLYVLSAVNLKKLTSDALTKKQLLKNCLYVFGSCTTIKKNRTNLKNYSVRACSILTVYKQQAFKFLQGDGFARFVSKSPCFMVRSNTSEASVPLTGRYTPSYVVYKAANLQIKHSVDSVLAVECFSISCKEKASGFQFVWKTNEDKMELDLTHTSDTFFYVNTKTRRAVGLFVRGKGFSFGSSFAQSKPELEAYINFSSAHDIQIFVVYGNSKNEIVSSITRIKQQGGRLNGLLSSDKHSVISEIENLYERAYFSRFVTGEGLREKYAASLKYVPTLHLPTLVYKVETMENFFAVVDRFALYKKMVEGCRNLNIVLLYSSQNDCVREIINAYVNRDEVNELIKRGVFLFFINKVTASAEATCFFSKMTEYTKFRNPKRNTSKGIEVVEHVSNTYPITHSLFTRNTGKSPVTASVVMQLDFAAPLNVVSRTNTCLNVVALNNGRASTYKLPPVCRVFDEKGAEVRDGSESITPNATVRFEVRLGAFEEKKFDVIRNDGVLTASSRKNIFLDSLQDIRVAAFDKRVTRLFSLPIEPKPCSAAMLASVKGAIKTADSNLFFALLGKLEALPCDIYKLLIERVLGVKHAKGQIQLLPKIELTGGFTLTFLYQSKPFEFVIKQVSSGFSVQYGNQESFNYLQVNI